MNRNFIAVLLMLAIGCINCTSSTEKAAGPALSSAPQPGFFHNVYFFLKTDPTEAEIKQFEAGLARLGTIETLVDYHIGRPAMTPREVVDNSYDYAIITSFKDKAGHDAYQVHPIHDDFRKEIAGVVDSVQIYDTLIQ